MLARNVLTCYVVGVLEDAEGLHEPGCDVPGRLRRKDGRLAVHHRGEVGLDRLLQFVHPAGVAALANDPELLAERRGALLVRHFVVPLQLDPPIGVVEPGERPQPLGQDMLAGEGSPDAEDAAS